MFSYHCKTFTITILGPVLCTTYIDTSTSSTTNYTLTLTHLHVDYTILYCCAKTAHKAFTILQLLANCKIVFLT